MPIIYLNNLEQIETYNKIYISIGSKITQIQQNNINQILPRFLFNIQNNDFNVPMQTVSIIIIDKFEENEISQHKKFIENYINIIFDLNFLDFINIQILFINDYLSQIILDNLKILLDNTNATNFNTIIANFVFYFNEHPNNEEESNLVNVYNLLDNFNKRICDTNYDECIYNWFGNIYNWQLQHLIYKFKIQQTIRFNILKLFKIVNNYDKRYDYLYKNLIDIENIFYKSNIIPSFFDYITSLEDE